MTNNGSCQANDSYLPIGEGVTHMTSSLLGSHVREGREHVATVSPTRTRWVSQE